MRRIALIAAAALLAACSEAPTGPEGTDLAVEPSFDVTPALSAGCYDLENNVTTTWNGFYGASGMGDNFVAGEVVSVSADYPAETPTSITLVKQIPAPLETFTAPFPGTLTYAVPADGFYSFSWGSFYGSATWTVSCSHPANTPPVATNDSYATDEDTPLVPVSSVLANDTDVDGNALTAVVASGASHGSVTLSPDGHFIYSPFANFNGSDSFTYRAYDGIAYSNVATVHITVNPVNDPPVAVGDSYAIDENTTLNEAGPGVLTNDTDVDGDALTATLVAGPGNGSLTLYADGSFTYTPNAGFYGSDSFTYHANDGLEDSNVATVSITVNRVIHLFIVISPDKKDALATINSKSNGLVAVAILGRPGEFELTEIDWATLAFGPAGATAAHDLSDPATWSAHVMDVDGNGAPDLVTHYSQKDTGLAPGDTEACLTGMISGVSVKACGAVTVR